LTLPDNTTEFSALPAQWMRLFDRGVLKQGMWADGVVFNPAAIRDKDPFENPNQFSKGKEFAAVNGVPVGVPVIEGGKMSGALPGKVLRGPGYVP
jgi:N-acyl-D-aspartate/D-glutamate deacylase